jgi:hypothetical protein
MHNHLRTHGHEGATELGGDGPRPKPAGLAHFRCRFGPLSLHPKDLQP